MAVGNYVLVAVLGIGLVQSLLQSGERSAKGSFFPRAVVSSDYCQAYCDGAAVTSYMNNCAGVFYAECKIYGMTIVTSCVGTWNETISAENKVETKCEGLFSSNVEGTIPSGESFKEHESCGGTIDYAYYVASPESVSPSSPVNSTCVGSYALGSMMEKSKLIDMVDSEGDGFTPPGYTCTYMCGDSPYDGIVCRDVFKVNCNVDMHGQKSTVVLTCDGTFVGDWSGSGCVGSYKGVDTGADYVYTETCSQYTGSKFQSTSEEKACVGAYSSTTAVSSPPSLVM
eukprot:TRINITY_DN920_c0_g1_i5.p2 TRINITY_DN920_c0_g1~~TRINITY_DN920_c0_g1_i5.p2  ORF type:complete len:284 (+),score=54.84 TRINITY_DN920_c0_g1_i5:126-977(+)